MVLLSTSFFWVPFGVSALDKEESKGLKTFEDSVDVSCNDARSLYRFLSCIGAHPSKWELHNVSEVKEHGIVPHYIIESFLSYIDTSNYVSQMIFP
jgi:hypothetical protein